MPQELTYAKKIQKLCQTQLRVGSVGFGGPLATMAMMRDELVDRHGLITENVYLEGLGVVKLLPGPVSFLLSIYLGQRVAGFLGGLCSGIVYALPSFLMILGICVFESKIGPQLVSSVAFQSAMHAVQFAVVGVILFTCYKLFLDCQKRKYGGREHRGMVSAFALLAFALSFWHAPELAILLLCAVSGWLVLRQGLAKQNSNTQLQTSVLALALIFFKAGLTVFGTGYMILPYLRRVLVDEKTLITAKQFLDGVAYGNLTPGPIVIASTYFGFQTLGFVGALAATAGIFGGPMLLMLCLGPVIRRFLGAPWIEGILLGLLPAVAATITFSLIPLCKSLQWSLMGPFLLVAAFLFSVKKIATWKVFLGSALLGALQALILR